MIRKVSFRNFKAYRSLDVELEPFTVLVGPNASGKTTLLDGLALISRVAANALSPSIKAFVRWNRSGFQSYGANTPPELSVDGVWSGTEGGVRIVGSKGVRLAPAKMPIAFKGDAEGFDVSGGWEGKAFQDLRHGKADSASVEAFRGALASTAVLRLDPRNLAGASYSDAPIPEVQTDGSGLASVLAYLKLSQDEVFDKIEQALNQIVPAVRRIRIERATVEQTAVRVIALDEQKHEVPETRTLWGNKVVLDMKGAKGVAATDAGEGTLMALGLLTVLMGPRKPRLVLLDDIELALHPAAQAKLVDALRAIQKHDPELQIVATSHSPFILNYLDPREVRMTFLAENGFARCEKLTAHPEFEKWRDLMSPGEFWSNVGENWLEKADETGAHE